MLSERIVLEQIEITLSGHIQVCRSHQVVRNAGEDNEEVVSEHPWRGVVDPGDSARAMELLGPQADIAGAAWQSLGIPVTG